MDEKKPDSGHECGHHHCCGKWVGAILLLLVGGLAGFFIGRCHSGMCKMKMSADQTAPATPAAAPAPAAPQK
jgi:hypothetical protein